MEEEIFSITLFWILSWVKNDKSHGEHCNKTENGNVGDDDITAYYASGNVTLTKVAAVLFNVINTH